MKNKRGFLGLLINRCAVEHMLCCSCIQKRYLSNQLIEKFLPWLKNYLKLTVILGLECFIAGDGFVHLLLAYFCQGL